MIILWMLIHFGLASGFFSFNSDEVATTLSPVTKKRVTVTAKGKRKIEIQRQTDYLKENVAICPEGGFYFKRDFAHSLPEVCYLCFCNSTGSSVCWPRDNRKCDANHFEQHNVVKRERRHRRSPMSLTDLFLRDGARDVFNANTKEQCKPHEASYSEGCPPADWCVGCTVCDCDANGRWDCHLLSFCSEEDKKKKKRRNKGKMYVQKSLDLGPSLPGPGSQNDLARRQVQNLAKYISKHGPITRKPKGKRNNKTGKINEDPLNGPYAEAIKSPGVLKKSSKVKKPFPFEKKVDKRQIRKVTAFKAQRINNITDKKISAKKKTVKAAKNPQKLVQKKKAPKNKVTPSELQKIVKSKRSTPLPYGRKVVKPKRKAPIQKRQAKTTTTKSPPPTKKSKSPTTRKPKPKRPKRRETLKATTTTSTTPRSTTCSLLERAAQFKKTFNVEKIALNMKQNLQQKLINEVQKAVLQQEQQQSKVVQKRSASKGPLVKKGIVKKNIQDQMRSNKTAPMKRSIKKTSKINVEKSNKVKLHRHKRSAVNNEYIAPAEAINPYVIPLRVISSKAPDLNTESMHKYYKYSLNNITSNASLAHEEYLTEIIYNRTSSAKRSIDKQIEDISKLSVVNLVDNANDTSILVRSIDDNKNVSYPTENVTTTTVKVTNVKPLPVIDKRVVIDEPHLLVDRNTLIVKEEANNIPNINITELKEYVTHVNTSYTTNVPVTVEHIKAIAKEQKSKHTVEVTESNSVTQIKPLVLVTPTVDRLKVSSVVDEKVVVVKEHDVKQHILKEYDAKDYVVTEHDFKVYDVKDISTIVTKQTFPNPTTEYMLNSKIKNDYKFVSGAISPPNVTEPIKKTTTENYLKTEYKLEENTIVKEKALKIQSNATIPSKEIVLKPVTENSFKYETDDIISLKKEIAKLKKLRKHKKAKARNKIIKQLEAEKKQEVPPLVNVSKHDNHMNNHNHDDLHARTDIRNDSSLNAIDINNLKLHDWHHDILKEYHSQEIKTSAKNLDKLKSNTEKYDNPKPLTTFPVLKKKVNTYDLKKISIKSKKRKLTKLVATLHNRTGNNKFFLGDPSALVKNNKNGTTSDLKGFFKNLLGGFSNKQAKKKSRRNRFKVIKYLQKFFKKLFSEAKHKKNKNLTNQFNKDNVIDSLCATFGPCNANIKNKAKLQPQIDHLNFETYQMLRSIKIIKGLLKLVDLEKNNVKLDKKNKFSGKSKSKKAIFKSDVQKLHAILKDQYIDKQHFDKLSDTQKIQVEYIKSNTQNFIQSAAKFAVVLNDIIDVITSPDLRNKNKKGETAKEEHRNKSKVVKDLKTERKRIIKSINNTVHEGDVNEPLKKLKDLVSRYSMIQNTFMRKIYRVLTNFDTKDRKLVRASTDVSKLMVQNKTEEIQVYTKNIIQNLRKLKNLAQNLSGGLRRKRELRDDDSIEYLLMLMEYLLKQNHPLDTAPVNDGIDLLIEAIKSAPDIKPIKKKVLLAANNINSVYNRKNVNKFNSQVFRNNTTTTTGKESTEVNLSREDSASDYNRISKEDNYTSNMEDTKDNTIDHSADEDENENKMLFNRRVYTAAPALTETDRIIYTEPRRVPVTQVYITSTRAPVRQTMPQMHPDVTEVKIRETKAHIEKVSNSSERVDDGKFEPFNADLEEDVSGTLTDSDFSSSTQFSTLIMETTTDVTQKMKYKHLNEKNEDASMSLSKSRIDWLDETYEEELKAELNMSVTTETAVVKQREITKPPPPPSTKVNDISGFSKEIIEEGQTMKRGNNAEEVMYKKEMDLLNSLDYGTEKSEVDNSDSKESNSDDKYSGDAFSSYEINK